MLLQSSNKLVQEYPEFLSDSPSVVVIGQMRIWHVHIFTSVERTENISVISTHKQEVQLTPVPYLRRPHGEGRGVTKTKTTIIIIITIILWSGAERVIILIRESDIEGIMLPFKPARCLHRNMSVSPEGQLKASWRPAEGQREWWVVSLFTVGFISSSTSALFVLHGEEIIGSHAVISLWCHQFSVSVGNIIKHLSHLQVRTQVFLC